MIDSLGFNYPQEQERKETENTVSYTHFKTCTSISNQTSTVIAVPGYTINETLLFLKISIRKPQKQYTNFDSKQDIHFPAHAKAGSCYLAFMKSHQCLSQKLVNQCNCQGKSLSFSNKSSSVGSKTVLINIQYQLHTRTGSNSLNIQTNQTNKTLSNSMKTEYTFIF